MTSKQREATMANGDVRVNEVPAFLDCGSRNAFAVLSIPPGPANGLGLIAVQGTGAGSCMGRNQMLVRMCRTAASDGFYTVRLDLPGLGDSPADRGEFRLEAPPIEEIVAAARWLSSRGIDRVSLYGTCFGGRTVLAASGQVVGVVRVIATSMPPEDRTEDARSSEAKEGVRQVRRLALATKPSTWMDHDLRRAVIRAARKRVLGQRSPSRTPSSQPNDGTPGHTLIECLDACLERDTPVTFLYGADDKAFRSWKALADQQLKDVLRRAAGSITVRTHPGLVHSLSTVAVQEWIVGEVLSVLREDRKAHANNVQGVPR